MNKDAICYKSDCADTAAATLKALQSYAPKKVLSSVRRYFRFRLKLKMASGVNLIAFGLTPTAIKSFQGCVLIDIGSTAQEWRSWELILLNSMLHLKVFNCRDKSDCAKLNAALKYLWAWPGLLSPVRSCAAKNKKSITVTSKNFELFFSK